VVEQTHPHADIRLSRNCAWLYWESEGLIVPFEDDRQQNDIRGKRPYFVQATKEWRVRRLR